MPMIAIRVPTETARMLENVAYQIPGDSQKTSEMHITVLQFDQSQISDIAQLMIACHSVTSKTSPFSVTFDEIDSFDSGKNGTPVIIPVKSEELLALNANLRQALDEHEIKYSKKFPEYKPHVTLSYIEESQARGRFPFPISFGACELFIVGAGCGGRGVEITLPFELPNMTLKMKTIADRVSANVGLLTREGIRKALKTQRSYS